MQFLVDIVSLDPASSDPDPTDPDPKHRFSDCLL